MTFIAFLFAFDFVGSAWSFGFFVPTTTTNDLRLITETLIHLKFTLDYFVIGKPSIRHSSPVVVTYSNDDARAGLYGVL